MIGRLIYIIARIFKKNVDAPKNTPPHQCDFSKEIEKAIVLYGTRQKWRALHDEHMIEVSDVVAGVANRLGGLQYLRTKRINGEQGDVYLRKRVERTLVDGMHDAHHWGEC
jgi:hypothetical protein